METTLARLLPFIHQAARQSLPGKAQASEEQLTYVVLYLHAFR